jgi:DNA-binding transcriptional LysR family regulator
VDRLTAMETFVCVVESGSFSAAARLLNVGQPAVSKSIAQLEERLAVRLLLRSTRGLTPTEAGHAFYERAKRAIEEADEAEFAARGSAGALSGRLRISAAVTFARLHILPRLQTFLDRHPELNIDIVLDDENIDLLEHGIDVALRMGVLGDSNMTARKVARGRRCVVGTPAWFAKAGEPRVPADLLSHQAIVYEQSGGGRCARGCARRHGRRDRFGMDVHAGTRKWCRSTRAARLGIAGYRPVGNFSQWAHGQCKGTRFRRLD